MLREAENPSDDEIEVVGEVMKVEVLAEVKKASPWYWNSLACSNCSRRCDDIAFQGINLYLASCGHFYCENCHTSFQHKNENYKPCKECKATIRKLTEINF